MFIPDSTLGILVGTGINRSRTGFNVSRVTHTQAHEMGYAQKKFGPSKIHGINFASSVPATRAIRLNGGRRETARVTEAMAMELLQTYEDRRIQHPADQRLRDDLRKPQKVTTPGGRVSIAATRDEAGHADHFWSFALALEAASHGGGCGFQVIKRPPRTAWL